MFMYNLKHFLMQNQMIHLLSFVHLVVFEISVATAWIDLENIMLSKISQSEKDKYHMIFHSYVESNEQTVLTSKI